VESLSRFFCRKPGSFNTAIFTLFFDLMASKVEPIIKATMMMGNKKVERRKVLFLTLVRYSLFITSHILFIK
jgi:hypothetical protein